MSNTFDFNQDIYLGIYKDLPFAGILTDEEIIAEQLNLPTAAPELEEDEPQPETVSRKEFYTCLEKKRLHLQQSSEDCSSPLKYLALMEKELSTSLRVKTVQTNTTSFF